MDTKEHQPTNDLTAGDRQANESASNTQPSPSREPDLSLDHTFEVLKNRRRREVLQYLRDREQETTLSDLAEYIAALENDTDVASITSSQRKRVYVGLYQCHLPKMADMDIIEFEQKRGTVRIGPNAEDLYEYLDSEPTGNGPEYTDYLWLSAAGFLVAPAVFVLSGIAEIVAFVALFGILTALCARSFLDAVDVTPSELVAG